MFEGITSFERTGNSDTQYKSYMAETFESDKLETWPKPRKIEETKDDMDAFPRRFNVLQGAKNGKLRHGLLVLAHFFDMQRDTGLY